MQDGSGVAVARSTTNVMPFEVQPAMKRRWFSSGSGGWLAIDSSEPSDDVQALHDAILLDDNAELLHVAAMILGRENSWEPADPGQSDQTTHSIFRCDNPSRVLALQVPPDRADFIQTVSMELSGLVGIIAHQQPCTIRLFVPELPDEDVQSLCVAGSILLLGDGISGVLPASVSTSEQEFAAALKINSGFLELEPMAATEPTDAALDRGVSVCLVDKPVLDIRKAMASQCFSIPCRLTPGTLVKLQVPDMSQRHRILPATIVRVGQALALRVDSIDSHAT